MENWPLVYNPWVIIAIVVAYIAACILGPRIMASRKPFELKPVLVVYNAAMVILSFYIAKEVRGAVHFVWSNLVPITFFTSVFPPADGCMCFATEVQLYM